MFVTCELIILLNIEKMVKAKVFEVSFFFFVLIFPHSRNIRTFPSNILKLVPFDVIMKDTPVVNTVCLNNQHSSGQVMTPHAAGRRNTVSLGENICL